MDNNYVEHSYCRTSFEWEKGMTSTFDNGGIYRRLSSIIVFIFDYGEDYNYTAIIKGFQNSYKLNLTSWQCDIWEFLLTMWRIRLYLLIFSVAGLAAKVPSKFKTLQCYAVSKDDGEFKVCEIKAINRHKSIINIKYLLKKMVDDFEVWKISK